MSEVFSVLLDRICDSYSEDWRHECECQCLLKEKSHSIKLNLYLYGVENRAQVVTKDASGQDRLQPDQSRLWDDPQIRPLSAYRGLQQTDKIHEDVLKLKALEKR
jgi:hypothetical protein